MESASTLYALGGRAQKAGRLKEAEDLWTRYLAKLEAELN